MGEFHLFMRLTCRSHTAWGWQFLGRRAGFGAWCLCDKRPGNGYKPGCETTGTCTPEDAATKEQQKEWALCNGKQTKRQRGALCNCVRGTNQRKEDGYLHIYDRNDALGLVKMPGNPVDRLGDKVQHQVEIHFIFLHSTGHGEKQIKVWFNTVYTPCLLWLSKWLKTQNLVSSHLFLQH